MARQRRKVFVDANDHGRWVVSYADFITLLFAFFVVMYSISSVNEGKYKSLTHSLGAAFSNGHQQGQALGPVGGGPAPDAVRTGPHDILAVPFESVASGRRTALPIPISIDMFKSSYRRPSNFDLSVHCGLLFSCKWHM
jgi:Membrane MotB of proton-channel complex MotA/MotB